MTLAVSENHSTIVADLSVRTSRRTSSSATAEIAADGERRDDADRLAVADAAAGRRTG